MSDVLSDSWVRVLQEYSYEQLCYLGLIHPADLDRLDVFGSREIFFDGKELFRK